MSNELLLIVSIVMIYGSLVMWYWLFGKTGLVAFTVLTTITANIEVLILIRAFGLDQTLGNVMFASSFLATDILSEIYGKKDAQKAVNVGIATSITFILFTQFWFLYNPSAADTAMQHLKPIFSSTPRMMTASLVVYAIAQRFDVWAYHKWWRFTERLCGDKRRYLWVRNNGSTLISQLLNSVLFGVFAFWGTYDAKTILSIIGSGYIIFIFTSLADTPMLYLARRLHDKKVIHDDIKEKIKIEA